MTDEQIIRSRKAREALAAARAEFDEAKKICQQTDSARIAAGVALQACFERLEKTRREVLEAVEGIKIDRVWVIEKE